MKSFKFELIWPTAQQKIAYFLIVGAQSVNHEGGGTTTK